MSEYSFFMDDSGTKEFQDKSVNLFAYTGVIIRNTDIAQLSSDIEDLKRRYFKGKIPELKSNWLRLPKCRSKYYLAPYSVSDRALTAFTQEYYTKIVSYPIHVIGVVVDKIRLSASYSKTVFYPSAVSYEFLMQRVANYSHQYSVHNVTPFMDDMTGKTPRGNEWKKLLIKQHKDLKTGRSPFYRTWVERKGMNYNVLSHRLEFLDSKDSEFIQMADLCGYNVYRQARDSWGNFDNEPFYSGYRQIKSIMHKDPKTGRITSFGAVVFPR